MNEPAKASFRQKALEEAEAFFPVFLYVWFLLAVFGLHKSLVLSQAHIIAHQGFAVAKAAAFAKVLFFSEKLPITRAFDRKPLFWPIMFKSAIFTVILILMDFAEQALLEKFWPAHHKGEGIDPGNIRILLSVGFLTFAALIPFFGFRELKSVLGESALRRLLFLRREQLIPVSAIPPAPQPPASE